MDTIAPADLQVAVMRLARRLRAERADHGLTLTQVSVLATLERHGPMSPGDLAAHERVRPPSMTRTLASLIELGLVSRTPSPTDGRQQIVAATERAIELLASDRARRAEWLGRQISALDPDDRAALSAAGPIIERLAGS